MSTNQNSKITTKVYVLHSNRKGDREREKNQQICKSYTKYSVCKFR